MFLQKPYKNFQNTDMQKEKKKNPLWILLQVIEMYKEGERELRLQ